MKIEEVKKRIADMQSCVNNLVKLQDFALFLDKSRDLKADEKLISGIEEDANLSNSFRNLMSSSAGYLLDEIKRLQKLIDNAEIKID